MKRYGKALMVIQRGFRQMMKRKANTIRESTGIQSVFGEKISALFQRGTVRPTKSNTWKRAIMMMLNQVCEKPFDGIVTVIPGKRLSDTKNTNTTYRLLCVCVCVCVCVDVRVCEGTHERVRGCRQEALIQRSRHTHKEAPVTHTHHHHHHHPHHHIHTHTHTHIHTHLHTDGHTPTQNEAPLENKQTNHTIPTSNASNLILANTFMIILKERELSMATGFVGIPLSGR
jgi:hypothetical protein